MKPTAPSYYWSPVLGILTSKQVVYMLFLDSQFGAASLRWSNPSFSREDYILFTSYQMFDDVKPNFVAKQVYDKYYTNTSS